MPICTKPQASKWAKQNKDHDGMLLSIICRYATFYQIPFRRIPIRREPV